MKKFSIDLKASAKGERKKAVKYLRGKGYEVPKRKNNIVKFELNNYLSNEHLGLDPCDEKDFYYYSGFSFNELLLTLPRDWDKLVEIVEEDLNEKTPVGVSFKEGVWYKHKYGNSMVCYSGEYEGFGIWENNWGEGWSIMALDTWTRATKEEIKEALVKEAKKRGFLNKPKKLNFPWRPEGDMCPIYDDSLFIYNKDLDYLDYGDVRIYKQGQWAEVIKEEVPEIGGYKLERHEDGLWGFGCTRFNKSLLKELCEARIDDSFLEETLDYIKKH